MQIKINNKITFKKITLLSLVLAFTHSALFAQSKSVLLEPVSGSQGMVSSQENLASTVGLDILKQGGNAVDSAVAVGFALAVTYPQAGNLGGGGFMMVYLAKEKKTIAIDYREMAPAAAHRDMFLDKDGKVDNEKARFSHLSSGVPGTVAGMIHALENYGTMTLQQVMAPAIDLAEKGITITPSFHHSINRARSRLIQNIHTRKTYFPNNEQAVDIGNLFIQSDLATTLKLIAAGGYKAFYKGEIARKISEDSLTNGGIITLEDLANYKALERTPVVGRYRGYEIVSMPPPSSGGIHLIQMLNILEGWQLNKNPLQSATTINHLVESMKRAYADRSIHLGDSDFYDVPLKTLTSKQYAAELHQKIEKKNFVPSNEIHPGKLPVYESLQTTHFSVMDKFGNAVSNTYTLNASYGNGRVAKGTGFIMNNEMDDFSSKPGSPNMFGLLGAGANSIEAGKRPLSSMTPTLVLKDGEIFMATGSIGGSRIITSVLQIIINVIDCKMNIAAATVAPRFHHQWYPDVLIMEKGFNIDVLNQLGKIGYIVDAPELHGNSYTPTGASIGRVQSIVKRGKQLKGYADPRQKGSRALGY